ncbi:T9SS type A sorting domain-containing protein [Winogradskyella sp. PE311]|uniref:T9SS type A sorting domain-containing protein n=1 Tax=Winogradskyella sp. PE311 TaxID=3366943 RepID=UPI00398084B6
MKTRLFCFAVIFISYGYSQNTFVPDDNFEQRLIQLGYDTGPLDDYVLTSNIDGITNLNLLNQNISDLTGIEDFSSLQNLDCRNNQLTQIDVSQNLALTGLLCQGNLLVNLDITQNTALTHLYCGLNQLSTLDTSQNTSLTFLSCYSNNLSVLDISQNPNLIEIYCLNNQISVLDTSQNPNITRIDCNNNQMSSINVSQSSNLLRLYCFNNQISEIDISQNTSLTVLSAFNNNLTILNAKNSNNSNFSLFQSYGNPNLNCIEVDNVVYSDANWSQIGPASSFSTNCHYTETYVPDDNFENYLETHNASGATVSVGDPTSMGNGIANDDYVATANINTVTNLDVNSLNITDLTGIEDFMALEELRSYNNQLTALNVTQNTALILLFCDQNQLTSLDITQNTALNFLRAYDNQLTNIDTTQNLQLTYLNVNNNQMSNLNITQNTALLELHYVNNQLPTLDISQNTLLTTLWCAANNITSIDVSLHPNLYFLECGINQLTSLDVTQNTQLLYLNFHNNLISNIDISQNNSLIQILAQNNQLTSLDVTQKTGLATLRCEYNQLASLDLSQNSALTFLFCYNNQLASLNVKNGNNTNVSFFNATSNPNLTCIEVDDAGYSTANWTNVDPVSTFVNNQTECETLSSETVEQLNFNIYPNPFKDVLFAEVEDKAKYEIISVNGQVIKTGHLETGTTKIQINDMSKGLYFIKISSKYKSETKKLIKQ